MRYKKGDVVRVVRDATKDLPISLMRRKGIVLGRGSSWDEEGLSAYAVEFPGRRKSSLMVWEDEIELVERKKTR